MVLGKRDRYVRDKIDSFGAKGSADMYRWGVLCERGVAKDVTNLVASRTNAEIFESVPCSENVLMSCEIVFSN
jgi:hypothetical protein